MSRTSLRILIVADSFLPVPPTHYGGIERVIDLLIKGLLERGHSVTLCAHPESNVGCRLIPLDAAGRLPGNLAVLRNAGRVTSAALTGGFDVIHCFGRLAYLGGLLPLRVAKVMSYQRRITPGRVTWARRMARHGSLSLVGCSSKLIEEFLPAPGFHTVYNAVDGERFVPRYRVADDAPLVFLGRLEEIKGPHLAVEVARRSGMKLVLAGNIPEQPRHRKFFDEQILPAVDGERVVYRGPVDDAAKSRLLSSSRALLMPILWEEPFGIVMAEALATGTPVVALRRGSVPEVVEHGRTGFVCESVEEMSRAVQRLGQLDRHDCRKAMEDRFSLTALVRGYEAVYRSTLSGMRVNSSRLSGSALWRVRQGGA